MDAPAPDEFAEILNSALTGSEISELRTEGRQLYAQSRFTPRPDEDSQWLEKSLATLGETCDRCGAVAKTYWHGLTFCRHCASTRIPGNRQ